MCLSQEAFRTLLVTDQQGSEQSDSEVLCWGIWYYKVFQIRRVPIIKAVDVTNVTKLPLLSDVYSVWSFQFIRNT